jgi:hypothetical protein
MPMPASTGARRAEAIDPSEAAFVINGSITDGLKLKSRNAESDSDLFERLKIMATKAINHWRPWWEEYDSLADMYAGRQWSEEDRRALERQMRPAITFNRVGPVIDSLQGLEINNREMVKAYPRKMGNAKESELWSGALMWARDKQGAEAEESDAFFDLALAGMFWTDTYIKPADKAPGSYDPGMDRVDPTEMAMDPETKKRNGRDSRYRCRIRSIPVETAKNMFPDAEDHELHAAWATYAGDTNGGDPVSRLPETYLFNDPRFSQGRRTNVTVVEIQWYQMEPYYRVQDPFTGEEVHMDRKTFDEAVRRMKLVRPDFKLISAKYQRKVFQRAFLGTRILARPPLPCPYDFSYQCATGKRDKTRGLWFGLARAMQDPQMWANKWLSQVMHILNSNAKGGILAEKGVFEDWKKVQANWTNPKYVAWLAAGRKAEEVGYREQAQFPVGVFELMKFAMQSVPDANGFSSELLGMADRDQPSSLEYQRRQAGMTVLASFFHSLRMYRKAQGECLLYILQKYMSDGRLIRITIDQGDEQYIPLMLQGDDGLIEYDLIVDEAPSSPNQKEAVWSILVQALPVLGQSLTPQMLTELLAYSPLPASIIAKMKAAQEQQGQDPAQAAQAKATTDLMGAQTEELKASALNKAAGAAAQQAKAAKDSSDAKATELETAAAQVAMLQAAVGGGQPQLPAPGATPSPAPAPSPQPAA